MRIRMSDVYRDYASPAAEAHRSWVNACEEAEEKARKAEQALADLRGSITRLIAQWRNDANGLSINGSQRKKALRECADALEAALTPQAGKQ